MVRQNNYELLIQKLDQFIRKFYVNKMIRGALYSVGAILLLFLLVSVLEHFNYFDRSGRKLLFFSFVGLSLLALTFWVFIPMLQYFRLGKVISHEQAAGIIGDHFTDVKDKLLNILQLRKQAEGQAGNELVLAGIDQKSEEISPVPFRSAINLSQNRKYLRYALPPLLILLILLFAAPSVITDSTKRLINNNKDFERPAPFSFVLNTDELSVVQYEDYKLDVQIEGEQLPNEVFIDVDNYQYRLKKEAPDRFSYTFNKVQDDVDFKLFSGVVNSRSYELDVLRKPNIIGFDVKLDYPGYTGRKDEELSNIGDLVLPEGTTIDWVFNAENTDDIQIKFGSEATPEATKRFSDELFTFKKKMTRAAAYKLFVSNEELNNADSIGYSITIIPDLYPEIKVEKFQDSLDNKLMYFVGEAADDYGIRSLSFNYRVKRADGQQGKLESVLLSRPNQRTAEYDYTFDLNELELGPGEEVTYYFEVFDNDGVNGSKSARTNLMVFATPTKEEYEAMAELNDEAIKDNLEKALEESRKIQDEMKRLREKLLQEDELDWQSRKELEKLLERQKELQKQMQEAKKAFEENKQNQEEFSETNEQTQEKQEQLQEMFEQSMSEEMQQLMEQIEELMQEMEKDEALEMLKEMEMNDQKREMELDRLNELFKQLELEQEMNKTIDKLEELAEKQEQLAEETEKGEKSQEELKKEQEELKEEFEEVKEQMEKIEEKNEELENKQDFEKPEEEMEDIERSMDESMEQLEQQENKDASQSQQNASQQMKQMAGNMQMQMQSSQMEQVQEDMEALRQLLENLVGLSFDQEDLIDNFERTEINTPRYVELVQEQFKLKDDFRLVEDSLQALSKRVFQIESFITEKVVEINSNMATSLEDLEERRKFQAADHQQRTMKNINDLALMLSETMNNMQQQMAGMMAGSQMCDAPKPGQQGQQGNQPQDKLSQGQEQLGEQMKQGMQKQKGGDELSAEEFAKMAARQAALRKALNEKQKKLSEQGQGSKELQELIDQMDKVETDLVNKKLTNEMMKRQQDIKTRLLEHEKAERQQEMDKQRKSTTGQDVARKMPPALEEYIKKRKAEVELYKNVSPALKPYYKNLVENYFKTLKTAPSSGSK